MKSNHKDQDFIREASQPRYWANSEDLNENNPIARPTNNHIIKSSSDYAVIKKIKGTVSKKKRRYQKDGFDLDLSYITNRIIAMGLPAENIEASYRNNIKHVNSFFQNYHSNHFKIYNLCSERSYRASHFEGAPVVKFPFDDKNPCLFPMIIDFCKDLADWLSANKKNVAGIHCLAGKGRTGLLIACYLLYSHFLGDSESALQYFAEKRTTNNYGVHVPSQIRYTRYFEKWLSLVDEWKKRRGFRHSSPFPHSEVGIDTLLPKTPIRLHALSLTSLPDYVTTDTKPWFTIKVNNQRVFSSKGCLEAVITNDSLFWKPKNHWGNRSLDPFLQLHADKNRESAIWKYTTTQQDSQSDSDSIDSENSFSFDEDDEVQWPANLHGSRPPPLSGDIQFDVFFLQTFGKSKLFGCWLNSMFVQLEPLLPVPPSASLFRASTMSSLSKPGLNKRSPSTPDFRKDKRMNICHQRSTTTPPAVWTAEWFFRRMSKSNHQHLNETSVSKTSYFDAPMEKKK